MAGKINCSFDIASFYSYLAVSYLLSNLQTLRDHNVEVEFHPTFAGAVFHDANNAPPWAVSQVKREYLDKYESARSKVDFGRPEIVLPDDLLDLWDLGWTQKSLRALLYIKEKYPPDVYHTAILYLFNAFWTKPRRRIRDAPILAETLAEITKDFHPSGGSGSTDKLFSTGQVKEIMAAQGSQEFKENLKLHTTQLGDRGAFGLPWFEVRSSEGREEPFWGSDRFHHIFQFLNLPIQEFKLLPATRAGSHKPKL